MGSWQLQEAKARFLKWLNSRENLDSYFKSGFKTHDQAAGAFQLGDLGNHREFEQQVLAAGGAQQRPQLLAQHCRAIEADANGAPAHRRIVLGRVRQIGENLVAADIERAEHDRPTLGLFIGTPVERGLIGDVGKGVARQERDLGAEQPDPLGTGRAQLREIEQQPGIQQKLDFDPVAGDRRDVAQGLVVSAPRRAGGDGRRDGPLDIGARAGQHHPVVAVDDRDVAGLDLPRRLRDAADDRDIEGAGDDRDMGGGRTFLLYQPLDPPMRVI